MAQWGIAYCHGPNYNFHAFNGYYVVSQQESGYPSMKAAFEAVQRAAALTEGCAPVEKDLIEALQLLYTWPASSFAAELGPAHSAAMRAVRANSQLLSLPCSPFTRPLRHRPCRWEPPDDDPARCPVSEVFTSSAFQHASAALESFASW